jgi:hypothetical protein
MTFEDKQAVAAELKASAEKIVADVKAAAEKLATEK